MASQQGDPIGGSFYNDLEVEGNQEDQERDRETYLSICGFDFIFCFFAHRRACRLERGMEGAVGAASGTGETGTGVGSESEVTERLDLGRVFGTDKACTFEFRTCLDC